MNSDSDSKGGILRKALKKDPDRVFFSPDFLLEFIQKYRSLHGVWKIKSKDYLNAVTRQNSWDELVDFCRSRGIPEADIAWVKKKVHTIRGTFNKENKKVNASIASGATENEVYRPKLWYYEQMLFLRTENPPCFVDSDEGPDASMSSPPSEAESESENGYGRSKAPGDVVENLLQWQMVRCKTRLKKGVMPHVFKKYKQKRENVSGKRTRPAKKAQESASKGTTTISGLDVVIKEETEIVDEDSLGGLGDSKEETATGHQKSSKRDYWTKRTPEKRKKPPNDTEMDDLRKTVLKKAASLLERPDDEFDALGTSISVKLRAVASRDYSQFMIADKLINDILYKGYQLQLSCNTTIIDSNVPEIIVPDKLHAHNSD